MKKIKITCLVGNLYLKGDKAPKKYYRNFDCLSIDIKNSQILIFFDESNIDSFNNFVGKLKDLKEDIQWFIGTNEEKTLKKCTIIEPTNNDNEIIFNTIGSSVIITGSEISI